MHQHVLNKTNRRRLSRNRTSLPNEAFAAERKKPRPLKSNVGAQDVVASLAIDRRDKDAMKLPRNQEAIVSEEKITGYLLSESHPVGKAKAMYFRKIGYTEKNVAQLREDLIKIAVTSAVSEEVGTPFGIKYIVDGDVASPDGTRARLRTVWIIETGEDFPRFVTAYPTGKRTTGE